MISELYKRFEKTWRAAKAQTDSRQVFDDLVARYSESHRRYHVLLHIEACLKELDEFLKAYPEHEPYYRVALELAIWFHDVIYEVRPPADGELNSEQKSAAFAEEVLLTAKVSGVIAAQVYRLVIATMHGHNLATEIDEQILVDVDLSILGQEPSVFDEYESQIREEYNWVEYGEYCRVRSGILQGFVDNGIYHTPYFKDKYEQTAKDNLRRSIAKLSG